MHIQVLKLAKMSHLGPSTENTPYVMACHLIIYDFVHVAVKHEVFDLHEL